MARKSAAQRRAEKRAEKEEEEEIKEEQDQEVIDMYANINSIRDTMRNLTPSVQQNEDEHNRWFDATYPSSGKKATAKGKHHTYQAIKKVRARFTATQLDMDQYETELNNEWAVEKSKTWHERDAYLEKAVTKINDYCKRFKTELKELLRQAGIHVPELEDDEEWDEDEEAAGENEEEHGPGEDSGDGDGPVVDEDVGGEAAPVMNQKARGKAAYVVDEDEEDEAQSDDEDEDKDKASDTEKKGKNKKKNKEKSKRKGKRK